MTISIGLMLLAILAIAGFQLYWLVNTYREQEENLAFRTSVVFRESMYQLQSEKLKLDSNFGFAIPRFMPAARTIRIDGKRRAPLDEEEMGRQRRFDILMRRNLRQQGDSTHHKRKGQSIFFKTEKDLKGDTVNRVDIIYTDSDSAGKYFATTDSYRRTRPGMKGTVGAASSPMRPVIGVLTNKDTTGKWTTAVKALKTMPDESTISIFKQLDSLQDSITVKEATTRYQAELSRENIAIPFTVYRIEGNVEVFDYPEDFISSGIVTLGFNHPYLLQMQLRNTFPYLLQKMIGQLLVSLLLVGVTVISFVMLLRSLIKQRKLTQLKNDLISNITHELKTPIATVRVAIEALKNFNALHDPRRTQEYLDISENELQRLSLLVDRVLKLSMFEKHQIELKEEAFDLQQLVKEVVASMRLQFDKYHAHVSVHTKGDDFVIKADRMHITSVIFNLLDNALKYSQDNPEIRVALEEHEHTIEISVRDNGIGIAPEYQKKIFDKFFRVPSGNTHNVKGYGLGLSYVAYVVQHHQGQIAVESELGAGSRFIIKFARAL